MVVTKEQGWRAHLGDDVVGEDAAVGPATDAEALRINELHGVVRRGSVWSRATTIDGPRGPAVICRALRLAWWRQGGQAPARSRYAGA